MEERNVRKGETRGMKRRKAGTKESKKFKQGYGCETRNHAKRSKERTNERKELKEGAKTRKQR